MRLYPSREGREQPTMEPDPSSTPTSGEVFYARTFILVTLAVLGFLLYRIALPFLGPFAWALFIAFLLHPLHSWLVDKLHGRASLSAMLLTVATLILLLGPLTALAAAFATQVTDLLQYAQQFAAAHRPGSFTDIRDIPLVGTVAAWLAHALDVSLLQIQEWAIDAARNVLRSLGAFGREVFLGAVGTVIGFAIMMFILFFAIRDGERGFAALRTLIPMSRAHKARLFEHLAGVTRALVYGTGVTAAVQGALVAIGFAIVGLPSPIVFGVLAALFALVPLAGTPVVWLPAAIVLAAQQHWYSAIFLVIWGGLVVTVDNVLRPLLVSGRAHVGTLTVFIGVLGGVSAFGAIGVFLGPLVVALVTALIRFALEVRGAANGEPRA